MSLLNVLVVIALLATVGAFALGIRSMARGGDFDLEHSEQYMYARVGLQGAAVLLMLLALLAANL